MNTTEQIKKEALKRSLKYQLKHKLASLLTQQQILEKNLNLRTEKRITNDSQPENNC